MGTEAARPTCYLAIRNDQTRANVEAQLAERGWRVVTKPTGLHLVEDLLGDHPTKIDLVIVEDRIPGIRGSTIAAGLRELGVEVPVRLLDSDQLMPLPLPFAA